MSFTKKALIQRLLQPTIIAQQGLWQEEITSVGTDIRSESEGYIPNPNYIPDFWNSNPTQDEIDACYEVQCENEEIWSDKLVDNTYVTTTTDFWKNIEREGISTTTGNWSQLETKNGEVIYESNDSYNGEATYISLIDNYNDDYVLGTISPSYLHRYKDTRDGRIWFDGDDFSYAVKVKTFTVNDVEFSNCLAESDGDEIVCPNLGLVYSEDYGSLQKHTASMTIDSTNGTPIIRSQSRFFEK
jgi:hypothetical protein